MSRLALTIEQPTSAAEATEGFANVVRFREPGSRRPKLELVAPTTKGRSSKEAIASLSAAANGDTRPGRGGATSDLAYAGRRGDAAATREGLTNEDEIHLTLMDFIATALIFLSAASGPALMWLLLRTAS
jgi:hypothetical protein